MFEVELIICIKIDLALNSLQRFICHKTQTTKQTLKHPEKYDFAYPKLKKKKNKTKNFFIEIVKDGAYL